MDDFAREALSRLPLAEAVFQLWGGVANSETLQTIFDTHRGRSYEKALSFETMVNLIADALLEHDGSGNKAFQRAADDDELPATVRAVYDKLGRIPISLSCGFLLTATQKLLDLVPVVRPPAPPSLCGMTRIAIDGKKLKHVAKRLKVARGAKGAVLGGKIAAALLLENGIIVALSANLDGEVSDAPLMPDLLAQLRASTSGPRLFVLDRQFCDLVQPNQITTGGDHYVIRYNAKVGFHPDADRTTLRGHDERGREYVEEWGWLGAASNPRRCYVRRITLKRPGEEDVILITDLLDAEVFPAEDLLATYLARWSIESVFQKITEVFHLRRLISSSPEGTIFQCAFCLLMYNMIEVVRSYVASSASVAVVDVSVENLFHDVHRQLIAWDELVGAEYTLAHMELAPSPAALRARLRELLDNAWVDRWKKAPAKKHQPPPTREKFPGGHTSMQRLRVQAKTKRRPPAPAVLHDHGK